MSGGFLTALAVSRGDSAGMNNDTTLITGAASGIGMHLAHEFARNGHPLVLNAPDAAELQVVAAEIRAAHGVAVQILPGDLEQPETAEAIFGQLQRAGMAIDILVNNAGQGFGGKWWEMPVEQDLAMVRLNIEALLRMTKLFLPPMLARGRGRLLTTALVAGFEAGSLLAVDHASKAFVLSWCEALAAELADTPITVSALCPDPADTDFFPQAGMVATRAFSKAILMAPQDVAKAGYEGLMKKELFIVPGGMNKVPVAARRILTEDAQARFNEKFYEEVPADEGSRIPGEFAMAAARR